MPEPFILGTRCMYAAGAVKLDVETAAIDMLAYTFMRAPGESVGTIARESAVDELAYKLNMDPIALRMPNEPDQGPTTGTPFSHALQADEVITRDAGLSRLGEPQRF